MIAHAITSVRLLLAFPVCLGLARPASIGAHWVLAAVLVAIVTDLIDGPVARRRGTASARGRLLDHSTDFLFVTSGLAGAATASTVSWALPPLIVLAFVQYVADSYWLYRSPRLRMSALGRWNGILYFVPLVTLPLARLGDGSDPLGLLALTGVFSMVLVASTVVSIGDRALARRPAQRSGHPSTDAGVR